MDKYDYSNKEQLDYHVKEYYQLLANLERAIQEYQVLELQSWW